MKTFSASGIWYVPGREDHQVSGRFDYSPEIGLEIVLTGSLSEGGLQFGPVTYPVIHGIVDDSPFGRKITLFNAFRQNFKVRMPGFSSEKVICNRGFVGDQFLDRGEVRFASARVRLSGLFDWTGISGIQSELVLDSDKTIVGIDVRYRRPDSIRIALDDATVSIDSVWTANSAPAEATLQEIVSIGITPHGHLNDEEILERLVSPLQDFLTLAMDSPSAIDDVALFHPGALDQHSDGGGRFHIMFRPIYVQPESTKQRTANEMLFSLHDVKDHIELMLRRWMQFCSRHGIARNMFFGPQYSTARYIDEKFLLLTQAMILFFEQTRPSNQTFADARSALEATLLGACSTMRPDWLQFALPSSAEMEFPWRLLDAIRKHEDLMGPIAGDDTEKFVADVARTRSYCLRRTQSDSNGVFEGQSLYWTIYKLRLLQSICILDEIGMPPSLIEACITRNTQYAHVAGQN